MLLRRKLKTMTSRQLINTGMTCLWTGVMMVAVNDRWTATPDLVDGLIYGLSAALIGMSIVFNIQGLHRRRLEKR